MNLDLQSKPVSSQYHVGDIFKSEGTLFKFFFEINSPVNEPIKGPAINPNGPRKKSPIITPKEAPI